MKIANQDLVKVLSRANECVRRLIEAGLSYEDLQVPIDNPEMRKRLVEFWKNQKLSAQRLPKVKVKMDKELIQASFLSLDSSRRYYTRMTLDRSLDDKILENRKLTDNYCKEMLEILMKHLEGKIPDRYLSLSIKAFCTYEDWYNYRCKNSEVKINDLRDVIKACLYQLFQDELTILGLPKTNEFEEEQAETVVEALEYFGYRVSRSEHEPVLNVGGIIIIRHQHESKEKFVYYQVTSRYYRNPLFDE